jgi:hypothetical protein
MNGVSRVEFDHEYGTSIGLPRHLEETLSSPKNSLLNLRLAKQSKRLALIAKITLVRQFSTFPQHIGLFWLKETNW